MEPPPFLCEELQLEILSWLPVKSLVRFKCISKSWKSTISDSQFIKLHLLRSSSKRNTDFTHLLSLVRSPPESPSAATTVAIPDEYIFSGTCNGLICLLTFEYLYLQFRLWNSATRSMSQHSPPLYFPINCNCYLGFGYDSSTDTYKVVVAVSHSVSWETTVHVYNMGYDTCWRTIQLSHFPSMCPGGDAVYVNNTLNWSAINLTYIGDSTQLMNSDPGTILSFDLGKETCAQLPLPYCNQDINWYVPNLGVLRDCLCFCQTDKETCFEIWQMKEFGVHESWTRLFHITGFESIFRNIQLWHSFAMYMSENGDALLLSKSRVPPFEAVLYTQKDNKLELMNIANDIVDCYAHNYIESLVSPC
ncbi:F-box/kelch-repeat protein At3g23880-like [Lotus japonicus]|uniref:F-box/kelch-repeat protein At3g23880-like n=1 Tax=Lotus japonicus TaxID=34305 RepID=UPI0025869095|nr:F-box/kelch-repeat protein At3g23880-like [Lotus japonicus]